jgi:UDP-N-acetylglucosamine--N-acetylmuramyl-(pentapeptide) pyrophosphoryl-undecaprenol N-acetylglucosamine transferase
MPHPVAVTSWSGQQAKPNARRFADVRVSLRRSRPGRASQPSQQLTRCQTEVQGAQSTQPSAPRVLIAAGGTGGHVYPAIAIADALTRNCSDRCTPAATVAFVGTRERLEWDAVHQARYEIHPITAVGLQRPLLRWANVLLPFRYVVTPRQIIVNKRLSHKPVPSVRRHSPSQRPPRLVLSLFQALLLVRRLRPQVVVGTGGYIAFPTCLAACLLRVPVVIQEQNAVPGLANRVLARLASLVCVAFSGTIGHLQSG